MTSLPFIPLQATATHQTSLLQFTWFELLLYPRHCALFLECNDKPVQVPVFSNTTWQLVTDRCVPDTMLSALCALFHLISATVLKVAQSYLCFAAEEAEA